MIAALLAESQTDPAFAAGVPGRRFVEREQGRAIFRRAIERGEVPPRHQGQGGLDLLYG